jgi:dynein heavy chain
MVKDFQPYSNLWLTARTWYQRSVEWKDGEWENLDPEELEMTFEQCLKNISTTARFFRDKAGLEKIMEVSNHIKGLVDEFKPVVPIAMSLRKTGMVDRHWDAISNAVGFDIRPCEGFTLQSCIDKGLLAHTELCEDTGEKAYKEFNIEKSLKKMKEEWMPLKFHLPQFKQTGTYIISGFDDAVQLLDEHIVTAQAMKFSPFRGPFEAEIIEWCDKMMTC